MDFRKMKKEEKRKTKMYYRTGLQVVSCMIKLNTTDNYAPSSSVPPSAPFHYFDVVLSNICL